MNLGRLALAASLTLTAWAHPMGNFSVSHYTRIEAGPAGVSLVYALDLAEIPTFELLRQWGVERSSPREELERKAAEQARQWTRNLRIKANGRAVAPHFQNAELAIADGAGGAPVMRIAARLTLPVAPGRIEFEDPNFAERAGWKEIVIVAAEGGTIGKASHSNQDRSQALTAYPADPMAAPPQDVKAELEWSVATGPGAAPAAVRPIAQPKAVAPPPDSATALPPVAPATSPTPPEPKARGTVVRGDFLSTLLRSRQIPFHLGLWGLAVAFGLGAVHALSPGHGKTIVAAYLVGARGTVKDALFLGGMVTFTHTISVFFLGFVTLFLSEYVAPQTLNPILSTISGVAIVWIGATLLFKRIQRLRGHTEHHHDHAHGHDHDHDHDHHDHDHDHHHGPGGHTHVPEGDVTMASLIALGASGGLVPCPSALVLLLSAISIQRIGLGMLLMVAFSLGLAAVLSAIGIVVLYAKNLLPDSQTMQRHPAFRLIPVFSAGVILCLGLLMTGVALGVIKGDGLAG